MYILRSHSFSALCNGTCQILRVFSYTLCPSYLSLLTFILALASRVLCASFNLILQHPFPNCPSALRSRPLSFHFLLLRLFIRVRLETLIGSSQSDWMPNHSGWMMILKQLAWLYWCVQALALGACTFCSLPVEHIFSLHFEH